MAKPSLNEKWVKALAFLDVRILQEGARAADIKAARDMFTEIRAETDGLIKRGADPSRQRGKRDGSAVSYYRVELLGSEDVLAEHRARAKEPFRCTRQIYDHVVEILAKSPKPMEFMDLFDELRNRLDAGMPDYRPRVCLRYLVGRELLKHARRRFERAHEPKEFERRAGAAWDSAKRQPWYPNSKT